MKYLELPIEKIVKYDENDMASIKCPVCEHREYSVILSKEGQTTLFCNKDEFSLTRKSDLTIHTDYSVYKDLSVDYMKRQAEDLRILFNKGLISYVALIGALKDGNKTFDYRDENRLRCEILACKEQRTAVATIFNGFEPKNMGVCKSHKEEFGDEF